MLEDLLEDEEADLSIDEPGEFNLLQYEQASNAYRDQIGHLIKLCVLLVGVSVALMGYAFTKNQPEALIFAAVVSAVNYAMIRPMYRLTIPALSIAVELETRIARAKAKRILRSQIVTTMVLQNLGCDYVTKLLAISNESNFEKKIDLLNRIPTPYVGPYVRTFRGLLAIVSIGQALLFLARFQ
jgi:hypothetical protein